MHSFYDRIPQAVVKIKGKQGQGVLVRNKLVITAAHCISWSSNGSMVLGDYFIEEIEAEGGRELKLAPIIVEPMTDLAVLGSLDGQEFPLEDDAFDNFCEMTTPAKISRNPFRADKVKIIQHQGFRPLREYEFRIHIYTHEGCWIQGTASVRHDSPMMFVKTDHVVKGGTSGSPILNDYGELVGIVSTAWGESGVEREGIHPIIRRALPVWIYNEITKQTVWVR